ncbi:3-phenylpropionate MFS transporter [Chungangia koreensis]|uniref:3-phenylpropionate MFS transporter n=1 Tax=Chungangia koreensis TaxID=752657 RepID=A0ABV8X3N3_9LACT
MKTQRWLSFNFFTFFFTWGVFLPYMVGWLTDGKGLTVIEASIIMGAGMIIRSLSTFLLFPEATKRSSLSSFMRYSALLSLIIVLFYIPSDSFGMLLVITVIFSLVYPNILAAMESSGSVLMQKENINYGKSRSYGSFGYIIAVLLIGIATYTWGENSIVWILILGLFLMVLTQFLPAPDTLKGPLHKSGTSGEGIYKTLLTSSSFITILLLTILLQGAHTSYYNYGFIYLKEIGVSAFYIGFILNIAVVSEIIVFAAADRLLSNTKVSTMFIIAAVGSTVRWLLIFLSPNVWMFVLSQLLHALSFGVAHYAFIKYISIRLPDEQIPAAQGMYAAFAMSLSTALLTFAGGPLYEYSPKIAFLGMTACSIPALILVLATRKKYSY